MESDNKIPSIAKVWGEKIVDLSPQQRMFAEKAINDVLFEATLGNLNRHSVQINIEPKATYEDQSNTSYSNIIYDEINEIETNDTSVYSLSLDSSSSMLPPIASIEDKPVEQWFSNFSEE